jgi:hypothetical protein
MNANCLKDCMLGACLTFGSAFSSPAQPYAVPWFKVAGGGGTSTGGGYQLSGTFGQTDAGRVAGGTYRSEGGFQVIALQQLGYPPLAITGSGTHYTLTWVTPEQGFIVQEATSLATPIVWSDVTGAASNFGATNLLILEIPATTTNRFYKLRRP